MTQQTPPPVEDSYHYNLVKRAIKIIDSSDRPLSLDELARQMGMNTHHFQKTFSQWAGVSPKRFQQYLTLGHVKSLIKEKHSHVHIADAAGLSSTGRLHDLFVRWEAMTPGDYAKGGADLTIFYGWHETPFGPTLVMATDKGMCGLGFLGDLSRETAEQDLMGRWPAAHFEHSEMQTLPYIKAALGGGDMSLHMIGAPFQIKVWEALMSIPSGQVTTYSNIAEAIGNPKAVRAVGTAVGRNPVSWLIPCHRVLRKSGDLGGYHWGLPVKRALLAYETLQSEAKDIENFALSEQNSAIAST